MSNAESLHPCAFQVRIRLQALRADVQARLRRGAAGPEAGGLAVHLLAALQGMARAAEASALAGFASVCIHVAESIESLTRQAEVPDSTLQTLLTWLYQADLYLRRGATNITAVALISPLRAPPLGRAFAPEEDSALLRSLLQPGNPYA